MSIKMLGGGLEQDILANPLKYSIPQLMHIKERGMASDLAVVLATQAITQQQKHMQMAQFLLTALILLVFME